jgi:MFS family permease
MPAAGQGTVMDEHRARWATTLIFFLTGFLYAAWATRIPAIKEQLGLSDGALAVAVVGLESGAIAGLPAGGALVSRAGSRWSLRLGFSTLPPALLLVAVAPGLPALAGALAAMAAATSVVDVAMNAQGVELERRRRRPLLSGLHAGHPFGLAVGGALGTVAAAADIPVRQHFAAVAGLGTLAGLSATRRLVREPAGQGGRRFVRPRGRLLALGVVAFCAFLLDGAAYTWSAVQVRSEHHAGAGLAAGAFTLFSLTLAVGRLFGDRLVTRLGRARLVQACGALAALGSAVAITAPATSASLAGWALFGLGLAPLAPTVLGAAPGTGGAPPAVAIAAVTTVGYLGSFSGPALIGALAQLGTLSAALSVLVVVGLLLALVGRRAMVQDQPLEGERPPRACGPTSDG